VVRNCIVKLFLAMMVLTLLLGAASFVQSSPAEADETALPAYGADANPTGNPIGGGVGYTHYYSASDLNAITVTTVSALTTALASATSGDIIWIPSGITITITTAYAKTIKSGVILASNRGQNGAAGGKIKWTYTSGSGMTALLSCQSNSKVSGLVLEGPIGTSGLSGSNGGSNIGLRGVNGSSGIEVENCEISKFALAGIYFNDGLLTDSNRHYVHHCYIHNCQRHGFGYGISEEGSSAFLAECNIFDENRHHIMAQAGQTNPNSYEVRYNEFYEAIYASDGDIYGTWYYSHQVDCHGGSDYGSSYYAGNILKIHHNTFYNNPGKPNVCIRGIPKTLCEVSWNWTVKSGTDGGQNPDSSQWTQYVSTSYYQRMTVHDNWYGTTPPSGGSVNNAPATPSAPVGTASGVISTQYQYQATTTDPDGDQVLYTFYWGDGSTSTTGLLDSGATASVSHTWTQPGTYGVSARATDSEGAASAWSSEMTMKIVNPTQPLPTTNVAPAKPSAPVGTASGVILTQYQYRTSTTDPDGDRVWYTFYWGDGSTSTTGLLDSGATASASHAWTQPGTYGVYVRATDSEGNASAWSSGTTVKIVKPFQPSTTTNNAPTTPSAPSGPTSGETSTVYQYAALTTDPDADTLLYTFNWGDGMSSTTAQVDSGVVSSASHTWTQPGTYAVQVKATDSEGAVSASSSALSVNVLSQPPAVPATPAPATPPPAPETPAAVTPTVEKPTESSPVGPSDAVEGEASENPLPASLDNGGSPLVPGHGSGLGWWLLGMSVMIGAAVLLTSAIVRETIPKPPRWYDGS
jgi:hypothetical protein